MKSPSLRVRFRRAIRALRSDEADISEVIEFIDETRPKLEMFRLPPEHPRTGGDV